jgi:uncharacterized protein YbaR (Trm112 family)
MMSDRPADSVDPKLLEILVCPLTKTPLEYDAQKQELISRAAKLAYPIRDGVPIMLPEEARLYRHARPRAAHPRLSGLAKTWMAGQRRAMRRRSSNGYARP